MPDAVLTVLRLDVKPPPISCLVQAKNHKMQKLKLGSAG